jgi:hypothetical protein
MNPFKRVEVDVRSAVFPIPAANQTLYNRVVVSWAMDPAFSDAGPWTFTLQRSADINDEFVNIATTVDQPWLYDDYTWANTTLSTCYYRVKLVTPSGTYYSTVQPAQGDWNRYDWTLAKEIVRKENLIMRKKVGTKGWLLRRKKLGTQCTVCVNPVTGQVLQSQCDTCYGTGITGGYYTPIEYWISQDPNKRITKLTMEQGIIAETMETARALAYPIVEPNDVWVSGTSNVRYFIQPDIASVARHRGTDLVINIRLKIVPANSSVYHIPVDVCPD